VFIVMSRPFLFLYGGGRRAIDRPPAAAESGYE